VVREVKTTTPETAGHRVCRSCQGFSKVSGVRPQLLPPGMRNPGQSKHRTKEHDAHRVLRSWSSKSSKRTRRSHAPGAEAGDSHARGAPKRRYRARDERAPHRSRKHRRCQTVQRARRPCTLSGSRPNSIAIEASASAVPTTHPPHHESFDSPKGPGYKAGPEGQCPEWMRR
jgi:hypothetical protein